MSDVIFTDGLIVKEGNFNEGNSHLKLSIKVEDFESFIKKHAEKGWLNLEVKTSKAGKVYSCLDTWKPSEVSKNNINKKEAEITEGDDLPF